jgi:glycosyl transferase family 11
LYEQAVPSLPHQFDRLKGMQIVVRQTAGLGNQLFQYAAGMYLARKLGGSLEIATDPTEKQTSHGHARPYLLSRFAVSAAVRPANSFDRLMLAARPRALWASRMIRGPLKIEVIKEAEESRHRYMELQVPAETRSVYLAGYWQTYRMAGSVEPELRRELRSLAPLQGVSRRVAEQIAATPNSASVHLRRGDYAAVFGESSLLSKRYYTNAVNHLRAQCGVEKLFVFSDDSAYAHQWAASDHSITVIDHTDSWTADEDLQLMALCRHHVIANSSFSWWGAWLNPRSDKVVIAPSTWLGLRTSDLDLLPPGWIVVEN